VQASFLQFDTAAKSVEATGNGSADIGFMAIDPLRADKIRFTAAYVKI
jgi:polar amino acid transport system substrate-binding protein